MAHLEQWAAIATILGTIAGIIKRDSIIRFFKARKTIKKLNPSLEVLKDFIEVEKKLFDDVFKEELSHNGSLTVKNIGLDLEFVSNSFPKYLRDNIENNQTYSFSYSGLHVNPDSTLIKPLIDGDSNIQSEQVKVSLDKLENCKRKYRERKNIKINLKPYDLPPTIHGLLINDNHLFIGYTIFNNNKKLCGSGDAYLYLKKDTTVPASVHYFEVFDDWFNYYNNEN